MDLTQQIAPLLDRHMVLPMLDFLMKKEVHPEADLLRAKYELLKGTNMIDFANSVHQQLTRSEETSAEFEAKRPAVLAEYEARESASAAVMKSLSEPIVREAVARADKTALRQILSARFAFDDASADALFEFAQCEFAVGSYEGAADILFHYRIVSTNAEKSLKALWGKLACEILLQKWDTALDDLLTLKDTIDAPTAASTSTSASPNNTAQLVARTYFIAWSLFVFFNHPKGRDALIDALTQPAYISAIQTTCPWALRYLTACIVTTKNRRKQLLLKELTRLVASERELRPITDPLLEFIHTLYTSYNFSEAHKSLALARPVLAGDFFLESMGEEFCETARTMVFETYVKVYREIDIGVLSATLGLSREEGEKWVVDLVRGVKMDAKIDSENNTVIMGAQYTSVFQNVIERTRNLTFRTNLLASNIEKREVELASRRAAAAGGEDGTGKKEGGGKKTPAAANVRFNK